MKQGLEQKLDEFNQKYARNIVFSDQKFYEKIREEQKEVRFPDYNELCLKSNQQYDRNLSRENLELKKIIVEQVSENVCKELAKDGLMEKVEGGYKPTQIGVCHEIWKRQKKILREEYNIRWLSPSDEHPLIMYD